jgi:acyl-coenzyme A synthetase/AMP-(fatty) acid ligase
VISWMKDCFKCGVFDSYGTTEIGGVAIDSTLNLESKRCDNVIIVV